MTNNDSIRWKSVKLRELTTKIGSGITPKGGSNVYQESGVIFLRSQNIQDGYLNLADVAYISREIDSSMASSRVKKNDVLYNITGASIGRSAIYSSDDQANVNQHVCIVRLRSDNPKFINYFLLSFEGKKQLDGFQAGGNRQGLNYQQLGSFKIDLPSLPEQSRIVTVLETWDKAIEKLENKIENKKNVKKQLMRELLSGKKRLAGFNTRWNTKEFGELVTLGKDRVDPKKDVTKHFCLELEHLDQVTGIIIGNSTTADTLSLKTVFKSGDVLFGKLRAYLRKYWLADRDGACSTEIWVFRTTKEIIPDYLFQIVQTDKFIYSATMSQGTHMPRSSWEVVASQEIDIPSVDEQDAIVKILNSAGKEIDILSNKLSLFQDQKKHLLNNLITGNIRTPETLS